MKTKIVCFFSAAAIAVVLSFIARQRTLIDLRVDNDSLRQQLDTQAMVLASETATEAQPTNSATPLSQEERLEVLRLRGQILPLRSELQAASNRVVALIQPKADRPMPAEISPAPQSQPAPPETQAMQAFPRSENYKNVQGLASALQQYLAQHAGELPDNLAKVQAFADPALPPGFIERFELMRSGIVPDEVRAYTLVAREKDTKQLSNGWWQRIYLFADGNASVQSQKGPQPDWQALERAVAEEARQRAQQRPSAAPR